MLKAVLLLALATGAWGSDIDSTLPVTISSGGQSVGVDGNKLRVETYQEPGSTQTTKLVYDGNTAKVDSNGNLQVAVNFSVSTTSFYSVDSGTTAATTAGQDNGIMFIVNPVASVKTLKVQFRSMGSYESAAHAFLYRTYSDAVVSSSGTAISIVKLRNSIPTSVASAYRLPTFTSKGGLIDSFAPGFNIPPIIINDNGGIVVEPGHNLLFTAYPDNNGRIVDYSIKWTEE